MSRGRWINLIDPPDEDDGDECACGKPTDPETGECRWCEAAISRAEDARADAKQCYTSEPY